MCPITLVSARVSCFANLTAEASLNSLQTRRPLDLHPNSSTYDLNLNLNWSKASLALALAQVHSLVELLFLWLNEVAVRR